MTTRILSRGNLHALKNGVGTAGNRDRFQHCFDCGSARTARTARFDSKAAIEVRCVLSHVTDNGG